MKIRYETLNDVLAFNVETSYVEEIKYVKVKIIFKEKISPKPLKLIWLEEILDVSGIWAPSFKDNEIRPNWGKRVVESQLARYMPIFTLYSNNKMNKYTLALSDVSNLISVGNGIIEENGIFENEITLFNTLISPIKEYELIMRIDCRNIFYYDAIKGCKDWWETIGNKACFIPDWARFPVYSSWYNFHQNLDENKLLEEVKLASKLGFKTLIIDDGWQCDDNNRGYAYTGDWNVCLTKFPNLKHFVDECHKLGIKVMLWYSVPFIGFNSTNHEKFKGMYLYDMKHLKCSVLDPRFKMVRDFINTLYIDAVKEYNLDGFKLDFIDAFYLYECSPKNYNDMDIIFLEEAIDCLLKGIYSNLSQLKEDILIEYRQAYVGPMVSSYGNMFRVGDCPYAANTNRREIVNLRLTSKLTPVHTDMIMWNINNSVEDCYRQLYSSLFAVPQISLLLNKLDSFQYRVIEKYLKYYYENMDILMKGCFEASLPDNNYAWAKSSLGIKDIVVLYGNNSYRIVNKKTDLFCLFDEEYLYLDLDEYSDIFVYNCINEIVNSYVNVKGIIKIKINGYCKINVTVKGE